MPVIRDTKRTQTHSTALAVTAGGSLVKRNIQGVTHEMQPKDQVSTNTETRI